MSQHRAALIPSQGKPLEVQSLTTPTPSDGEVLIKTHAIAINPVDHMIQDTGMFVTSWPKLVGSDIAGEVLEIGSSVSNINLKTGTRVLAAPTYLLTGKNEHAGFQEIVAVPEAAVTPIPDSLSFEEAAVLPLSIATVAAGFYPKDCLGLDFPSTSPKPNGKKLLVWGGSGSVGSSAVQLGVASGYEVVVTCSAKNMEYVKSLGKGFGGVVKCFDYKTPGIVGDLVEELGEKCVGAYDAVGSQDTEMQIATVLAQLGGGTIASVLQPPKEGLPATVTAKWVYAVTIFAPPAEVGKAIFDDFLPKALAEGKFVAAPRPEVVGTGLESLQGAMMKHKAGVSATKIVVTL